MKTVLATCLALCGFTTLCAQPRQRTQKEPVYEFTLADSNIVTGQILRQDSSVVVVRKRGGDLTFIQPQQIVGKAVLTLRRPANTPPELTTFRLKDSSTVAGYVVNQTPVAVVVRQPNGTQTYIDPADILGTSSVPVVASPGVRLAQNNVGAPYLMSSRTAYTPTQGSVYYRNTNLLRNEAEVGVTNGWSLGVIANPLIQSNGDVDYLLRTIYNVGEFGTQFYTRIGIPIGNKLRIGGGLMAQLQSPAYLDELRATLMGQALVTLGDPQTNVTLSYVFRISQRRFPISTQGEGTLNVGTMVRLGPWVSFISDNTIWVNAPNLNRLARLSAAVRLNNRQHAFDLGILTTADQEFFGFYRATPKLRVYPYLGYIVRFGKE